jgi:hypothetical protein
MVGFPDGPLTGAPINFPRAAQPGDCCPPSFLQLQSYTVPYDTPGAEVLIEGCDLCDSAGNVEVVRVPDLSTGVVDPVLLAVACDPPTEPTKLDQMLLTFDTDRARGTFAVKITNDCGCCELVPIELVPPI